MEHQRINLYPLEHDRRFNDILLGSIDEAITGLLSRKVVEALYIYLQNACSIRKEEVPYRLEALSAVIDETFGLAGSRTVTKAIARKLYSKLALPFQDNTPRTLREYVDEAKVKLAEGEGRV